MCFFSSFHFKPIAVTAFVRFRGNFWHEQEGGQTFFSFSEKIDLVFYKRLFFFPVKKTTTKGLCLWGRPTVRAHKHLLFSCPCGSRITIFCLPWCGKTKPQVCLLFHDCWSYFTCAYHSCLSSGKIALRSK